MKQGKAFHGQLVAFINGNDLIIANTGSDSFWAVRCLGKATVFPKLVDGQFWDWVKLGLLQAEYESMTVWPAVSWEELDSLLDTARFQEKVTALLRASYAVDINPLPALRKRFGGKWEYLNPNGFSDEPDEADWTIIFKPDSEHWVGYTK